MSVGSASKEYVKKQVKKKVKRKVAQTVGTKLLFPILIVIVISFLALMLLTIMVGQPQDVEENNISEYSVNGGYVQNPLGSYAVNEVPEEFKGIYQEIGSKYNVDWEILAAIHRVETAFSSNNTVSTAGAFGHTQFMKCTWVGWSYPGCNGTLGNADVPENVYTDPEKISQYGGEGVDGNGNGKADPMEISDALSATAKKLEKDGVNSNTESAVFNYNRSDDYVSKVLNHYNAYKSDVSFVTAGIEDVENLGSPSSGGIPTDFAFDGEFPPPNGSEYDIITPTYPWGQCTWYVHQRRAEIGAPLPTTLSHGGLWYSRAKSQGYNTGDTPTEGAAASFPFGYMNTPEAYGHVAFVEKVNDDGSIIISESNVEGLGVISQRKLTASEAEGLNYVY